MKIAELRKLVKGKTHYFDPGTMSFFGSRVSNIEHIADDYIFARETLSNGFCPNSPRIRRGLVISPISGNILKVDWSDCYKVLSLLVDYHRAERASTKKAITMKIIKLSNLYTIGESQP